jgi:hypothetical protein
MSLLHLIEKEDEKYDEKGSVDSFLFDVPTFDSKGR